METEGGRKKRENDELESRNRLRITGYGAVMYLCYRNSIRDSLISYSYGYYIAILAFSRDVDVVVYGNLMQLDDFIYSPANHLPVCWTNRLYPTSASTNDHLSSVMHSLHPAIPAQTRVLNKCQSISVISRKTDPANCLSLRHES